MENLDLATNMNIEPKKRFTLRKPVRVAILFLLYLCVLAINMSMKILAVSASQIQNKMGITPETFSLLGTVFHIGTFVSTIFLMFLFKNPDRKRTVMISLFGAGIILALYKFITTPFLLIPFQFLLGLFSMSINIYVVIWIDQFGMFYYKTVFLTVIGLFKSLGNVFAILLNHFMGSAQYQDSFLYESIFILALGIALIPFSRKYFSSRVYLYKAKTVDDQDLVWKPKNPQNDQEKNSEENLLSSVYRYRNSESSTEQMNPLQVVLGAFKNRIWVMGLFAVAILNTATCGFNFWVNDYLNKEFQVKDEKKLYTTIIIELAGPIGASIFNFIISLYIGGYHHRKTSIIMICFYSLATFFGNLIPYSENYSVNIVFISFFFLGAAAMVPHLQGTNFSGGTLSKKPYTILAANLVGTLLGAAPGPFLLAKINSRCNNDYTQSLKYFMKYLIIGWIFDLLMMIFKLATYEKKPAEKEDKGTELENK